MASLPPPALGAQGDPQIHAERMSRIDGCPEACGNTEAPYRVKTVGDGFVAWYGCEDCGYFWQTAWRD